MILSNLISKAYRNVHGLMTQLSDTNYLHNGFDYFLSLFDAAADGSRVLVAPGVWHVCEMQLHLAAVIAHKEHTHVYYEYFRSHFGGNMSALWWEKWW